MYSTFFKEGKEADDVAVAMACLLVIGQVCLAAFLLFLIYRSKRLTVHLLAANAVAGTLAFALLVRPGTIRLSLQFLPVTEAYCVMYHFAHQVEMFVLPWALFMYTVDRLMYIRDPTVYAQKESRKGLIAMLVVPWAIAVCVAIIDTAMVEGVLLQFTTNDNYTYHGCNKISGAIEYVYFAETYAVLICRAIPTLIGLIVAIVSLSMWCCFKRRQTVGNIYDMMNDEVVRTVRDSVIAVSILNAFAPFYLLTWILASFFMRLSSVMIYHVLYFGFPLVECVVWVTTLPQLRQDARASCCCRRDGGLGSRVHYGNQTVDIDNVTPESDTTCEHGQNNL